MNTSPEIEESDWLDRHTFEAIVTCARCRAFDARLVLNVDHEQAHDPCEHCSATEVEDA